VNPPYQRPPAAKLDEQKNIIADLCIRAPNTAVRDCLRKYDPSKQQWQITNGFEAESKKVLVETLAYLGKPDMDKYLAKALPNELFCRIQNLLPDTCHLCKDIYCLKVDDKPVVSCVKCGQGCHNKCILDRINKTEDDLVALNPVEREALINPHSSIGLFYVCGPCQVSTIPQKKGLMKKISFARDLENQNAAPPNQQTAPPKNTPAINTDGAATDTPNTPHMAAPAANNPAGVNLSGALTPGSVTPNTATTAAANYSCSCCEQYPTRKCTTTN